MLIYVCVLRYQKGVPSVPNSQSVDKIPSVDKQISTSQVFHLVFHKCSKCSTSRGFFAHFGRKLRVFPSPPPPPCFVSSV